MIIFQRNIIILFLLSTLLAIQYSCMRNRITVPSITEDRDGIYQYGKFVWHDLITDNVPVAMDFYANLFGWEFEGRGGDGAPYLTAYKNEQPVAGFVKSDRLQEGVNESRWISYISVMDVDKICGAVLNNNGIIYREPMDLEVRGRIAIAGDSQGATFGLITANGGDPVENNPESGFWLWDELLTRDPENVGIFYRELFGYEVQKIGGEIENIYDVLSSNGINRAGMTKIPWKNVKPNWLPYIMVEDIQNSVNKAINLGGTIILSPNPSIRNGTTVIISDPTGAVFGMQKWPN